MAYWERAKFWRKGMSRLDGTVVLQVREVTENGVEAAGGGRLLFFLASPDEGAWWSQSLSPPDLTDPATEGAALDVIRGVQGEEELTLCMPWAYAGEDEPEWHVGPAHARGSIGPGGSTRTEALEAALVYLDERGLLP